MTLKEKALKQAAIYAESYMKYCIENPGYIMHNDGIREMAYNQIAEECNVIDDVKAKELKHRELYKQMTGPNGHYIIAECCKTFIKQLEEEG